MGWVALESVGADSSAFDVVVYFSKFHGLGQKSRSLSIPLKAGAVINGAAQCVSLTKRQNWHILGDFMPCEVARWAIKLFDFFRYS